MEKISGVYKIENIITGDFYIGSSKDVKRRWNEHKAPSVWNKRPNSPLYQDMQKYGVENFQFQILVLLVPECLKQAEQELIETLNPTYNDKRANGFDVERQKEYQKEYRGQLCSYNGETLTLPALSKRFGRARIKYPRLEAKKYLTRNN